MNTDSSTGNFSQKRTFQPGLVRWILRLLRMFWLAALTLLLMVLYGLYLGWSTRPQWSDGLFYAAVAQFLIAGIAVVGGSSQTVVDSSYVRYINKGDISETRQQLSMDFLNKMNFGVRACIGGVLTLLISGIILWG